MGTLTSCSFMPLNSEFRSNPVRRAFRERIQCHKLTRLRGTSCFFSRARVPKWGKSKLPNFDSLRSFATKNDNSDGDKDNSNHVGAAGEESGGDDSKSNVTTTMAEEERGFTSEKSTPPSTSHRVSHYLQKQKKWFLNSLLGFVYLCLRSFNSICCFFIHMKELNSEKFRTTHILLLNLNLI